MGGRGIGMGGRTGMGWAGWAVNGTSMTGDGHAGSNALNASVRAELHREAA